MKKNIKAIAISLIIFLITSIMYFIYNYPNIKSIKLKSKEPAMTIIYTDKTNITHYVLYDFKTQNTKEIYSHENKDFPVGIITKDKMQLFYIDKTPDLKLHLFKLNIENDGNIGKEITIPNLNIDFINIADNRIFMRVRQLDNKYRRNFNIAVYNLESKKTDIWNKDETDLSIFNFCYNPNTHRIYAIERSEMECRTIHLPEVPTHKIVEFDENGNRIKELFKMNVFLENISVSKDGNKALVAGSTDLPKPYVYLVDLKNSTVKTVLESNNYYDNKEFTGKSPIFSPDENGFYFLAITPESKTISSKFGEKFRSRGVYYYDFKTKNIKKIFMRDDGTVRYFNISY